MRKQESSDQLSLPYVEADGTATQGWSGSSASRDRAKREAKDGTAHRRQTQAMTLLVVRAQKGATWKRLADTYGMHHGQASGVLSALHKAGRIARLAEKEDRCHIYVLPAHVNGREVQPHGGRPKQIEGLTEADLQAAEEEGYQRGLLEGRRQGVRQGVADADRAVIEFIDRLSEASRRVAGPAPAGSGGHLRHPVPALRAVKAFVEKQGVML